MDATLIERLEAAMGPDRELDFAIWMEIAKPSQPMQFVANSPHYSSSLDAAMTLAPDEWTAW